MAPPDIGTSNGTPSSGVTGGRRQSALVDGEVGCTCAQALGVFDVDGAG
jgi:hypothetical protein